MIRISTDNDMVVIKPLTETDLCDTRLLYNSDSDIQYATGMDQSISISELAYRLALVEDSDNEFAAGIFIKPGLYINGNISDVRFAGLCSGFLNNDSVWIRQLSILPELRRKGIGTGAAESILNYFRHSNGSSGAYLSVIDRNTAGLCFWERLGFSKVRSIEKTLFDEEYPLQIIIMHKKL